MRFYKLIVPSLLCSLMAVPASAQRQQNDRSDSRDRAQQSQSTQRDRNQDRQRQTDQRDARRAGIEGRVVRTKKIEIRNANLEHFVALVRTRDGRALPVDLGPVKKLDKAKIMTGDQISAAGKVVKVGERSVLMADRIRKNGQTTEIERKRPASSRVTAYRGELPGQQDQQSRRASGEGEVVKTGQISVRDTGEEHLIVLLKTESGQVRVADLGPAKNLESAKIAVGDTLAVSGNVVAVGDRQVLMADQVRSDRGEKQIQRSDSKRKSSDNQSRDESASEDQKDRSDRQNRDRSSR